MDASLVAWCLLSALAGAVAERKGLLPRRLPRRRLRVRAEPDTARVPARTQGVRDACRSLLATRQWPFAEDVYVGDRRVDFLVAIPGTLVCAVAVEMEGRLYGRPDWDAWWHFPPGKARAVMFENPARTADALAASVASVGHEVAVATVRVMGPGTRFPHGAPPDHVHADELGRWLDEREGWEDAGATSAFGDMARRSANAGPDDRVLRNEADAARRREALRLARASARP